MPMTPFITNARLNEQTGMVLAYYGYDQSQTRPEDIKAVLGPDWIGIDDPANTRAKLVDGLGAGGNCV